MNTCMKYSINLCIVQYIMEPQAIMNPERVTYIWVNNIYELQDACGTSHLKLSKVSKDKRS